MLTNIAGRHDNLSLRDVIVFQENDLEKITDILILVDYSTHAVDQMNDSLSHPITRCSLSTKDRNTRCKLLALLWSHCLDGQVPMDNTKDVHLLALVFMYTLYLDIKESRWVDSDLGGCLDVLSKSYLVGVLNLSPLLLKLLVVGILLKFVQKSKIFEEAQAS